MRKRLTRPPRRLAAQCLYIRKHFCEPIVIEELAGRAGCSTTQFIAMFRRFYGTSPKNYVTSLRLGRAKLLLVLTDWPIFEVSLSCGYMNEFYFYRLFRRRFGITPSAYREKLLREKRGNTECLL